jgi:L-iditol 2-dehydrogenase
MGNPIKEMTIEKSTYSQILRKEIVMIGTWNSSYNQVINDWEATIKAMADGTVEYESLITHKYPLSKCNEALEMMRDKKEFYTKVTLVSE